MKKNEQRGSVDGDVIGIGAVLAAMIAFVIIDSRPAPAPPAPTKIEHVTNGHGIKEICYEGAVYLENASGGITAKIVPNDRKTIWYGVPC